jgi:hypothetical protein
MAKFANQSDPVELPADRLADVGVQRNSSDESGP